MAAAREGTLSLLKMLLTCLSIVRSLRNSSAAMALFVLPAATRRRTCSSRGVSSDRCAEVERSRSRVEASEIRRGSQSFEDGSGSAELEVARLVVPE